MSGGQLKNFTGEFPPHVVARERVRVPMKMRASTAAILAGVGHGATFLALTTGSLWLAAQGSEALPAVRRIFVAGLYMQALPAFGFAILTRYLSQVGHRGATLGAGGLSLASLALLGVGTLQVVGFGSLQSLFLAVALILVTAVGIGALATRLAHGLGDRYESEPLEAVSPDED